MKMILQKREKVLASLLVLLALLALGAFVVLVVILPVDWTLREKVGSEILMGLFVAIVALLFSSVGLVLGYSWGRWATLCLSCLTLLSSF
jgi:Na+-translocating ferredoxin:NAD+ oxidoreductase RnfE subunit